MEFKFCLVCQSSFVNQKNYDRHILTKSHLTNYEKILEQKNKEFEIWQERELHTSSYFYKNCIFCNTNFLYRDRFQHTNKCEYVKFIFKYDKKNYKHEIDCNDIHSLDKNLNYIDRKIKFAQHIINSFDIMKLMNIYN